MIDFSQITQLILATIVIIMLWRNVLYSFTYGYIGTGIMFFIIMICLTYWYAQLLVFMYEQYKRRK